MSAADGKLRAARLTCSEATWERDRAERDAQWKRWMDCYAALDGVADPAAQVARWKRMEAAAHKALPIVREALVEERRAYLLSVERNGTEHYDPPDTCEPLTAADTALKASYDRQNDAAWLGSVERAIVSGNLRRCLH